MIKLDKRIVLLISITIVISASFQPIISGKNILRIKNEIESIDENTSLYIAYNKLKNLKKTNFEITDSNVISDNYGLPLCYVFDLKPQGYIVVTCYQILPPVLAYSFTSSFFEGGNLLYDLVKEDIKLRLTHSSKICEDVIKEYRNLWNSYQDNDYLNSDDSVIQWPKEGATVSGGWLETEWHQDSPFNDMVPMDMNTNQRSVAGCPSVAMAQILNYHQTTNNVQFNDSDDYYHNWGNYFWIDDDYESYDFPSFPQLNSYLDTLVEHYKNDIVLTDEDKASLTFACGVACKQVYSTVVSGTFG